MRILCLHGFGMNKSIFNQQLMEFKKNFKDVEFISINGPLEIDPSVLEDPTLINLFEEKEKNSYIWYSYFYNIKLNDTVEYILNFIRKEGPFDGILGFSQGGTVAAYLTYYCEYMRTINNDQNIFTPRFVILICPGSFFPPFQNQNFRIKTPSHIFIGKKDFLFMKGILTSTLFLSPIISFLPYSHKIPKLGEKEINDIKNLLKNIERKKILEKNLRNNSKL